MGIFIDRSNVNPGDDYARADVNHAYFKATEGTGFTDATFAGRTAEARRAGAQCGAYHYAANTNAVDECDFFLNSIPAPRKGDLRPCVDVERSQNGTPNTEWVVAFVEHARKRLGYWPVVYGNTSTLEPMRSSSPVIRACGWWRAEYGPDDGRPHPLMGGDQGCAAHQYTSQAHFPGIGSNTDASIMMRADIMTVPGPVAKHRTPYPAVAWRWARWRVGVGEYTNHAGDHAMRPSHAPARIPARWWRLVGWYKRNVLK